MTHAERCQAESTRDVIFLLRYRLPRIGWTVDSVWLDRAEAEAFRAAHEYRWSNSQVYGVPSSGQLSELLRRDPTLPCEWVMSRKTIGYGDMITSCGDYYGKDENRGGFRFCPYCGRPIEVKEASS